MNTENDMKKNILWNTIGTVFYCVCQWVMTILVVRLTPDYVAAGNLSLAMTTSSTFSAISLFSMRNFQISDVNGKYQTSIYLGSRVVTCLLAFALCSIWIAGNSYTVAQKICIEAFMLIRLAEAQVDVFHGMIQKYWRFDMIGKSYLLRGFITVIFFSLFLKLTGELSSALIIVSICNLACAIFYDSYQAKKIENWKIVFDKRIISLLKECLPIVIFTFLLNAVNLIPKLVLEKKIGTEALGIYSSIASPVLIVQLLASVIFNPMVPLFGNAYQEKNRKRYKELVKKTIIGLIVLCVVSCTGAIVFGKLGLNILFGTSIIPYFYLLLPIVLCTILTAGIWIFSAILVAVRKTKILMYGMIVDFVFCYSIVGKVIIRYTMNGVSYTQIIVLGVYLLYLIYEVLRIGNTAEMQ